MPTPLFKFGVGLLVLHVAHTKDHRGWRGIVTAQEFYKDQDGEGLWYYVRWITPEGKVDGDKLRIPECELRAFGPND